MTRVVAALLCSVILLVGRTANAVEGVQSALLIHQRDVERARDVLLYTDTVDFLADIEATGFFVGLSFGIKVTGVDSNLARFMVHVYTLASQPKNYARSFQVEYGLPAELDSIIGKRGAQYSLTVVPIRPIDIDTTHCGYLHSADNHFRFDPTAHMDLYYVPNTLGDFHWNSVKGMMEEEYRRFDGLNNFNLPGKYNLYLCPCKLHSVIWDDRFGMMVDPTRNTAFSIYTKQFNSTYPFVINQTAIMRHYGYSPPFLCEGFANYLSFAIHGMKKLYREGKAVPLDSLLDTYSYYQTAPILADRTSASFVRYLIDQYGISRFLDLYRKSDDIHLRGPLEEIYRKPIAELETEWLTYVDTITVSFGQASYYCLLAETMLDFPLMLEYAQEMSRTAASRSDSLEALSQLVRSHFFVGDYYAASETQQQRLRLDSSDANGWVSLASYFMMNGEYERAAAGLSYARTLDSTSAIVLFNQALFHLNQGEEQKARRLFSMVAGNREGGGLTESSVLLGDLLARSGNKDDQAEATALFSQVVGGLSSVTGRHSYSASQTMWLGISYLGLGETGNADSFLQTAEFLETRPFYQGMIQLWLGKVADVRGEHGIARDHYGRVLSSLSAYYHKEEARKYIESPYGQ